MFENPFRTLIREALTPPPATPEWDAFGHTVLIAFARLRELEAAPRINGGKAGTAQVRERYEARTRAWKLLDDWVEGRRLNGRSVDGMSMPADLGAVTGSFQWGES